MKLRIVDGLLLIAIAVGGALAWQTGRERIRLTARHEGLARMTGDLPIGDPTKVHVLALETGEPMHFGWRVYFPPNYKQVLSDNTGGQSTSWSSEASEFIARVRLRANERGVLEVYTRFGGGSSRHSIGDKALADLLRDHWDKVRVDQLGAARLAVIEPGRSAVLLRLTLPEDVQAEARKRLAEYEQKQYVPVLFELDIGPKAAKP